MTDTHDVVIVGAGFGGMGAAIQLTRMGIDDIIIVERESDVGGTWHVNHYPGLAVDIPSAVYSYSFEPNPYWSRLFAPGDELKAYAAHVADTYDLRRFMRFDTAVDSARWDEDAERWLVTSDGGDVIAARYLITATGYLSQPRLPDIDGIDSFAGTVVHSAKWDDDLDLTGRRAAVIGTGATGVQLIPEVAKHVAELTVYQRTPIWVTPKRDRDIPERVQRLFARFPVTQRAARTLNTVVLEAMTLLGVLHYRQTRRLASRAEGLALGHLRRQVRDPELRRKLTPDYSFGCKRPTFSNDYYPTFTMPHVHLETTPIDRVEPDGIVTTDGTKVTLDTLILATGFNLWDTNFPAFEVIGRDDRNLGKWWRDNRFQAYEGVSVPRFPNLLCLHGPYSYTGLSYFWTIESQMLHIDRLFTELRRRRATTFEVTEAANDAFLESMTDKLGDSVFAVGNCATANSYYFNPHGEASLLRPTSVRRAFKEAANFPLDDYSYT